MQKKLIALGYSCGSSGADGIFGQEHITLFANFRKQMVYPLTELLDLLLGRKLMLYMQNCKMDIR